MTSLLPAKGTSRSAVQANITVALTFPFMILTGVFFGSYKNDEIVHVIWITAWLLTIQYFMMANSDWRARYRDYYLASYLIRALEFGLRYREALAETGLAIMTGFAMALPRAFSGLRSGTLWSTKGLLAPGTLKRKCARAQNAAVTT